MSCWVLIRLPRYQFLNICGDPVYYLALGVSITEKPIRAACATVTSIISGGEVMTVNFGPPGWGQALTYDTQ